MARALANRPLDLRPSGAVIQTLQPLRGRAHLAAAAVALERLDASVDSLDSWGCAIAEALRSGARLLAAGNGGSAAQAQHLTAELVGRYRADRPPFSALALHAETSTVTALVNDYPPDELFARQVRAHGRRGDVFLALSTSGRSRNLILAADQARSAGLDTYALTGPGPNPLAQACAHSVCIDAQAANVQEMHQIAIHVMCAAFDDTIAGL